MVENLKTYSLWNKMEAVYPIMGDTLTKAGYNLKYPSAYVLQLQNPSEISNYGIVFNYDTPKIMYPSLSGTSHHISIYVKDALTDKYTHINAGDMSNSNYSITIPQSGNVYFTFGYGSHEGKMNNSMGRGYFIFNKVNERAQVYQDATKIIDELNSQSQPFKNDYIYFNQISQGFYSNPIHYGFITIGYGLEETLCNKLHSIANNFLKSMGRLYV